MNPARSSDDMFRRQASDFAALLGGGKTVLVAAHKSPDGDAIASLLAAARLLILLGSHPLRALEGVVPSRFAFLSDADKVYNATDLPEGACDAVLTVDCGSLPRLGAVADRINPQQLIVNIDHHPDNTLFGRLNLVYPDASSTTELLFNLATALELPLDSTLATLLYTGLMTDTGSFRYSSTSSQSFAMAARLAQAGADPAAVAEAVYGTNSPAGAKLLGEAMLSLEFFAQGRVAAMTVPQPDTYEELEEITDFALTIKGIRAIALFRVGKNATRISLRGRGPYNVAQIARKYGGGGHEKAAGFTFYGPFEEIRAKVLGELREEVEDQAEAELAVEQIPPAPLEKGESEG